MAVNVLERSQYAALSSPASCDFYMQTGPAAPESGDMDPRGLSAATADPLLRAQLTRQYFWCADYSQSISIPGGSGKVTFAPCDGVVRFYAVASTSAHYARLYGNTIAQSARSSDNPDDRILLTVDVAKGKAIYATYSVSKLCSITLYPSLGAI